MKSTFVSRAVRLSGRLASAPIAATVQTGQAAHGQNDIEPDLGVQAGAAIIDLPDMAQTEVLAGSGPMIVNDRGLKRESEEAVEAEAAPSTAVAILTQADRDESRLAEIRKILHDHAAMTVLVRAELIKEFVGLVEGKFGQNVQKSKRGRPGVISKLAREAAARELPVKGKSDDARRKAIERALLIANISEAAKEAARRAKLDDNQKDLLAIADEDEEAQLQKVDDLATPRTRKGGPPDPSPDDKEDATVEREDEQHDNRLTEGGEITSGTSAPESIPQSMAPDEALGVLCDFARFVIERIGRRGKNIVITVIEDDVHEFNSLLGTAKLAIASKEP